MTTAAWQLLAEGLRDHFAPALRTLGFTGWRYTFSVPDRAHWALLGVEVAAAGAGDPAVRYTLNLSVTAKDAWAGRAPRQRGSLRPDPNTASGLESWRARIGELLPAGGDVWWEIAPGPRWLVAVEDSVAAVRRYGLPELLRRLEEPATRTYLSAVELEEVNAALARAAVSRIRRTELTADGELLLRGAWVRSDRVARRVLESTAEGFLSAGDERYHRVRVFDTLGRELWSLGAPGRSEADRPDGG
ncbi:hypothetical protein [Kitasatospora camelliae]|uniref:DUF4304 domain-containing protein n=1 Tax=Kitasatospora camelliae TaxID=3156397 RepID=A0AAU8JVM7_9ACTN